MTALRVVEHPGYRELLIDDGKVNALAQPLLDSLNQAVSAAADAGQALLIVGRPGCFSAGYDLKVMQGSDTEARLRLRAAGGALRRALLAHPAPVVMACSGHAMAMGAYLLLCGDFRVGVDGDFRVALTETAIGMPMPETGVALARARLAPHWLARCVLNAQRLTPAQAVSAGFLDELATAETLLGTARGELERLLKLDAAAFAETRRRLNAPLLDALDSAGMD